MVPSERAPGPEAPRPRGRLFVRVFALTAGLAALVFASTIVGSVDIPWNVSLSIVLHQATSGVAFPSPCGPSVSAAQCSIWTEIVWGARVPPLLLAVLAGAALGLSGGTLQGTFRNPLVDPYLLGLSTGAAAGVAILFTFHLDPAHQSSLLPVFAFLGAFAPGMVVYLAAGRGGRSVEVLLLTGVALNFLFSAILDLLLLYNPANNLQVNFWLLGGLSDAGWTNDTFLLGVLLIAGTLLALHGRELNVLQLGPEVAESVGVDAPRTTRRLVLLTTVVTGVAVAFTGVIGFIGLVAPHMVRRLTGPDYRLVLPVSGLVGAGFLVVAWDVAQTAFRPVVIPVGIPTALAGVPFFLYLLYRRWAPVRG
jgi:iron complex transport system permease protein